MPDPILINPDNRLLSFSTHDMGLYGGQISPDLHIGPPAIVPVPASAPADAGDSSPKGDAEPQPNFDAGETIEPVSTSPDAPVEPQASNLFSDAAAWQLASAFLPQTSGSSTPQVLEAPATAPTIGLVQGASLAPEIQTAQPAAPQADPAAALQEMVGTIPAFVPTLSPAVASAEDTVAAALDLATTPLAEVDLPGALAGIESLQLDATTTGPLSDAALPFVDDDLTDVLGADPVGGVATLVSLVSISDVFDIGDGDAPAASAEPAPGLLDALTADLPAESPLLGDVHDDDGPLGDLPHDDPLGVI